MRTFATATPVAVALAVALLAAAPAGGASAHAVAADARAGAAARHRAPVGSAAGDARLLGAFAMNGRITVAVRVPGEQPGELLARRWSLAPGSCTGSVCAAVLLTRERAAGVVESLVLRRIAPGLYSGLGAFRLALSCRGRTYPGAEYVPYRIVIAVASVQAVQSVAFATAITARYENRVRKAKTRCPLGPSHDAAVYTGTALSPPPAPPQAAFSAAVEAGTRTARFGDASTPSPGGGAIVARAWDFGDPASGAADHSSDAQPAHAFATPGAHVVTLTVTDANGLTASSSQQLVL